MTTKTLFQSTLRLVDTLSFSTETKKSLDSHISLSFFEKHTNYCHALTKIQDAENANKQMFDSLAPTDPDGMQQLSIYLGAAAITHTLYQKAGIPEHIFFDTMSCFPRFVNETFEKEGHYCFDRGFWVWRQTSCRLFTLGTLEYEYRILSNSEPLPPGLKAGQAVLSVHIPSTAVLSSELLRTSYQSALDFFKGPASRFCECGSPKGIICGSWLLAPILSRFLSASSGIRQFAQDYMIYAEDPQDENFYLWVFGKKEDPQKLPQTTSLQRAVRTHLLSGGTIGSAYGILNIQ